MSDGSYGSILLSPPAGVELGEIAMLRFAAAWNVHVEAGYGFANPTRDDNGFIEFEGEADTSWGDGLEEHADNDISYTFDTKYELGGTEALCRYLSATYPEATVRMHREWTGDGEPTTEGFTWINGELVTATTDAEMPVDLPAVAAQHAEHLVRLSGLYTKGVPESIDSAMLDTATLLTTLTTREELTRAGFDTAGSASSQHYIDTGRYLLA